MDGTNGRGRDIIFLRVVGRDGRTRCVGIVPTSRDRQHRRRGSRRPARRPGGGAGTGVGRVGRDGSVSRTLMRPVSLSANGSSSDVESTGRAPARARNRAGAVAHRQRGRLRHRDGSRGWTGVALEVLRRLRPRRSAEAIRSPRGGRHLGGRSRDRLRRERATSAARQPSIAATVIGPGVAPTSSPTCTAVGDPCRQHYARWS